MDEPEFQLPDLPSLTITVQGGGRLSVQTTGLPQDMILLLGLLEAAKEAIRTQFATRPSKIALPPGVTAWARD